VIDLSRDGAVFVLRMTAGENRFNQAFLGAINAALDEVEGSTGPAALVTTGEGKFYSNGLDLDWLATGAADLAGFIPGVENLLARVMGLPMVTVAALNGHVFAGGALLALTHDFRIMRADRGFFCLPEIDIKIPFTPGMDALITRRLPAQTAHEAIVTGRRYGGIEAAERGIVDTAVAEDRVLPMPSNGPPRWPARIGRPCAPSRTGSTAT
jgi:Delta3-Delta2-enoyl-CoA isomerase